MAELGERRGTPATAERDAFRERVVAIATDTNGYRGLVNIFGPDQFTRLHAHVLGMCWRIADVLGAEHEPDFRIVGGRIVDWCCDTHRADFESGITDSHSGGSDA